MGKKNNKQNEVNAAAVENTAVENTAVENTAVENTAVENTNNEAATSNEAESVDTLSVFERSILSDAAHFGMTHGLVMWHTTSSGKTYTSALAVKIRNVNEQAILRAIIKARILVAEKDKAAAELHAAKVCGVKFNGLAGVLKCQHCVYVHNGKVNPIGVVSATGRNFGADTKLTNAIKKRLADYTDSHNGAIDFAAPELREIVDCLAQIPAISRTHFAAVANTLEEYYNTSCKEYADEAASLRKAQ